MSNRLNRPSMARKQETSFFSVAPGLRLPLLSASRCTDVSGKQTDSRALPLLQKGFVGCATPRFSIPPRGQNLSPTPIGHRTARLPNVLLLASPCLAVLPIFLNKNSEPHAGATVTLLIATAATIGVVA